MWTAHMICSVIRHSSHVHRTGTIPDTEITAGSRREGALNYMDRDCSISFALWAREELTFLVQT